MTTMASAPKAVIGGVDTHADAHVAAVCDQLGAVLGTRSFPTTARGYRQLLAWLRSFGSVEKVGVEGTGSYGVGLTRVLLAAEVEVVEVLRPNRQTRRRHDKTDVVTRSLRPGRCSPVTPPVSPRPTTAAASRE